MTADNGEKLLIPRELYEREKQLEEQLMAERSTTENLQQQLDRYREQFGEL